MASKSRRAQKYRISKGDVIDAALELAHRDGWSKVRMMHLALRLDVPIAEILKQFRDMDAIADSWFERMALVLGQPASEDFKAKSPPERLFDVMIRWFEAFEPHRKVSADMIAEKLYPSHPHHWVPLVFSLSRLVHLFLDAALINSHGRQRQVEELGVSILILSTLRVWCRDQSEDQRSTRKHLRERLSQGDFIMFGLFKAKSG